ncbi:MAG: hypothetical protein CLLPBCKN_002228 [Chroococcidiopsis cubana SAG 39.79]|uniref:RepB-like DNA primase domain-containing protein n=1 Tax=Chroococcidiopsis cubana SAG 39.79 TaxID=388085 RepID=A0AB37UN82_9CYAN|nr:VapE domain-containing protein [Chroococcidiopsis cubana]MDZ4872832.1 hypothetical protein [Chroococcidiopsis cubana SAG 39.79]PSB66050.1 hypothetical protein C7B79_02765 [Chroococcidiopsis cubana CCALA 043]RUT12845.1 hypothetical protein DSM107010_19750 [Chroococcidiopsis cubana SAG 39.79]
MQNFIVTETQQFLQALDPTAEKFTFQTFDDNSSRKDSALVVTLHGSLEQHVETLNRLNAKGAGVFVTVNSTNFKGRKAENIINYRALFVDNDNHLPQDYHLQPSAIVKTSGNKGHSYWFLREPSTKLEAFKPSQVRLIQRYNSDACIHDLPRVLRLPGFYHMKGDEPQLVKLIACDAALRYTTEEVTKALATPQSQQTTSTTTTLDGWLEKVKNAADGERNSTLNQAGYYVGQLITQGAVDEKVAKSQLTVAAMESGLDLEEVASTLPRAIDDGKASNPTSFSKSNTKKLLTILEDEYSHRLSWDVLQQKPRVDGELIDFPTVEMDITRKHDIHVDSSKLSSYMTALAKEQPFNPVVEYLEAVAAEVEPSPDIIDVLASDVLGLSDPLERVYLKRFLIAAVARAFEPGCKVDTLFILKGKQGTGKTTFFQELFGKEYFATVGETGNERDELLTLHQKWVLEYGEFENAASKKDVSAMKNFLSRQVDNFRAPYGSRAEDYPRRFVLCGTTNKDQFLFDETGNRRFWVANIPHSINLLWVKAHRAEVWSAAVALYKAGQQWWLTETEQALQESSTKTYEAKSIWFDIIDAWLQGGKACYGGERYKEGQPFLTKDVLLNAIGKPAGQWTSADERNVAKVLKALELEQKEMRVNGIKGRYWVGTPKLPEMQAVWVNTANDVCEDF